MKKNTEEMNLVFEKATDEKKNREETAKRFKEIMRIVKEVLKR